MNLRRIERIAQELEQKLNLEAGDELIDQAEQAVADGKDTLPEAIDERTKNEQEQENLPPAAFEADDDMNQLNSEIEEVENSIDDAEQADEVQQVNDDIADLEQQLDGEEPVESVEAPEEEPADDFEENKADAKACIACLKRFIRIAKAVKMSKDMPACKKDEVLSKIQKASEKLRKAVAASDGIDNGDDDASDHPAIQTFISIFNSKRGKLNSIMKGRGKGNQRIRTLLGQDFDNKMIGTMTLAELFKTLSSVLGKLK